MTFKESLKARLFEEEVGTYIGGRFNTEFSEQISEFCKLYNIPNAMGEDHHVTIMYSKNIPGYIPPDKEVIYLSKPTDFHVFPSGNKKALVVKLTSPELVKRHNELMKLDGATYDHPEYIVHVTLSYDIGDFDYSKLNIDDLKHIDFSVVKEYREDLNKTWVSSKKGQ